MHNGPCTAKLGPVNALSSPCLGTCLPYVGGSLPGNLSTGTDSPGPSTLATDGHAQFPCTPPGDCVISRCLQESPETDQISSPGGRPVVPARCDPSTASEVTVAPASSLGD